MKIRIIFDKEAISKDLHTGWGVSFLIDNRVLFDAGEKGPWLIQNLEKMKVDFSKLEAVVISHDHWDHTGGLWDLLDKLKGLKVYACPNFSQEFKDMVKRFKGVLIETEKATKISKDIYVTGEIGGTYKGKNLPEQALVAKTKNGITIVTGCAHPGILEITNRAKELFSKEDIYLVFGGFHLKDSSKGEINSIVDKFRKMDVKKVGPTHCSGKEAEETFKENYGKNFISIKTGQIFTI